MIQRADWGAFPPICSAPGMPPIYQLVWWSALLKRWVYLVAQHTGRELPESVVEMTPGDFARVFGLCAIGMKHRDALFQVLGLRPA